MLHPSRLMMPRLIGVSGCDTTVIAGACNPHSESACLLQLCVVAPLLAEDRSRSSPVRGQALARASSATPPAVSSGQPLPGGRPFCAGGAARPKGLWGALRRHPSPPPPPPPPKRAPPPPRRDIKTGPKRPG